MGLDAMCRGEIFDSTHCIFALMRWGLACKLNCCRGFVISTWKIELFSPSTPPLALFSPSHPCCSFLFSISLCKALSITEVCFSVAHPINSVCAWKFINSSSYQGGMGRQCYLGACYSHPLPLVPCLLASHSEGWPCTENTIPVQCWPKRTHCSQALQCQ